MAIHYIPTEYQKPKTSTMGLFLRNMQPLMNMMIQHSMQKDMLDKQVDIDKERVTAVNKEWGRRYKIAKEDEVPSLAATLYNDYGILRSGKGLVKFDKKNGTISNISPPEVDNIKNEQIAKWVADKTLIPVDKGYSPGSPKFKLQDTNYYFNPNKEEKPTNLIEQYNLSKKEGYEGSFLKWKKEVAKAGASNINIGERKLKAQELITASNARPELLRNKYDKDFYMGNRALFHLTNKENEVAYLGKEKTWTGKTREVVKIIKLPKRALDNDWTPERVHEEAILSGMSMRDFLEKVLKIPVR